jgi:Heavy metal associated domain 2
MIVRVAPSAPPRVALVHHHPGRLRLRGDILLRSQLRSESAAARVRDALSGMDGVGRVVHNATSGSVVVEYEPERIDADVILGAVAGAGMRLDENPRRPDVSRAFVGAARGLNAHVGNATRGAADLHGVVSFALGVGAVTSLVLGRQPRWPRWDSLLYWSYTFFRDVHVRDLERSGRRPTR